MKKIRFSADIFLRSSYFVATIMALSGISISPANGKEIHFYEHSNSQGDVHAVDLKPNQCYDFPGNWNDRVSSVNTHDACIFVYNDIGCSGKTTRIAPGTPSHGHLAAIGINDEISSTKLCDGDEKPEEGDGDMERVALEEHNKRRRLHGTPDLVWNNSIQRQAQNYADYLAANNKFEHSGTKGVGENLAANGESNRVEAVRHSLKQWYDNEKPKYDYNNPGFSLQTGHFTQVVWRNTKELGVGVAWDSKNRRSVIVAQYGPPGNVEGQYEENVPRPQ